MPRRHWDIGFAGNALAYEFPGTAWLMMALDGIGGLVAIVGGAMYLLDHRVLGVLRQADRDARVRARARADGIAGPLRRRRGALTGYGSARSWSRRERSSLALVFLVSFVLYYFVNWKYLSTVWPLK